MSEVSDGHPDQVICWRIFTAEFFLGLRKLALEPSLPHVLNFQSSLGRVEILCIRKVLSFSWRNES